LATPATGADKRRTVFDAEDDFILKSIKIYANSPGIRMIELGKRTAANAYNPSIWTAVQLKKGENTVILDFFVTKGTDYVLVMHCDADGTFINDTWRATDGAGSFYKTYTDNKLSASSLITIKTNNFAEGNSRLPVEWYVGFDWKVQRMTCDPNYIPASISSISNDGIAVDVYPNPSNDGMVQLKVDLEKNAAISVNVYNVLGVLVSSKNYDAAVKQLNTFVDLSSYSKGIYMIQVSTSNGFNTVKKVVVE